MLCWSYREYMDVTVITRNKYKGHQTYVCKQALLVPLLTGKLVYDDFC